MRKGIIIAAIVCITLLTLVSFGVVAQNFGVIGKGSQKEDSYIIVFKDRPDRGLIRGLGGDIKGTHRIVPAISAKLPQQAVEALKKNPRIKYIEPDGRVHATDQTLPWGVARIGAQEVHPHDTGAGIKVAILDSGIDYNHPDLDDNYIDGYDFVNGDSDPMDDYGHGTHCAGIIGAEDNDQGVVGVAPESHLYGVKVLSSSGGGSISNLISGIEWAVENDMQIATMSLGTDSYSEALEEACNSAYNEGLLLIAAAGNDGNRWGVGDSVDYPARFDSVIAVGAIDENDERAIFSSSGPDLEIAAPGVNIYSTDLSGTYTLKDGTSMACPHVGGTAALILSTYTQYDNVQVRERLQQTVEDLGNPGKDNLYGYGLVDAQNAVDLIAPSISNVSSEVTSSSAIIIWSTDEKSNSTVRYGEGSPSMEVSDPALTFAHSVELMGLKKDTLYHYEVFSADLSGNVGVADNNGSYYTFKTLPNQPPVANAGNDMITSDGNNDGVEPVLLNGSSSYDPDGNVNTYEWTEDDISLGASEQLTFNFSQGEHTVTLTVTDDNGGSDSDKINITILPDQPPVALAKLNRSVIYANQTVKFNASLSYDPDGEIVSYSWDMGSATKSGAVVEYAFKSIGNYTVYLTTTDNGGATDTCHLNLTVEEKPVKNVHVGEIDVTIEKRRAYMRAVAFVTVLDGDDNPVKDCKVYGTWSGSSNNYARGKTYGNGKAILYSEWVDRGERRDFIITVDYLQKDDYVYDAGENVISAKNFSSR